jgi:hypothetical protein
MHSRTWIAVALILAAGIAAHGGLYQIVGAGPESAYVVNRLTGEVRHISGSTWRRVTPALQPMDREFQK